MKTQKLRTLVSSDVIKSLEYYPSTRLLVVEFVTSGKYEYPDISRWVYDAFLVAKVKGESIGKVFNKVLRNINGTAQKTHLGLDRTDKLW